jgi:hypothetical protein
LCAGTIILLYNVKEQSDRKFEIAFFNGLKLENWTSRARKLLIWALFRTCLMDFGSLEFCRKLQNTPTNPRLSMSKNTIVFVCKFAIYILVKNSLEPAWLYSIVMGSRNVKI